MPASPVLASLPRALRGAALPDAERTHVIRPAFPGRALTWDDVRLSDVLPPRPELPAEVTVFRPRPGFVPPSTLATVAPAAPAPVATPKPAPKARASKAPLAPWLVKPTGKAKTGREYLAAYWRKAFPAPLPSKPPASLPALLAHPAWAGATAAPITPAMVHAATVRAENAAARASAAREAEREARRRGDGACYALERQANNLEGEAELARATLRRLTDPRAVRYVHPSGAELIHVPQD